MLPDEYIIIAQKGCESIKSIEKFCGEKFSTVKKEKGKAIFIHIINGELYQWGDRITHFDNENVPIITFIEWQKLMKTGDT